MSSNATKQNEDHNLSVPEELVDIVAGTGRWQFLITALLSFTILAVPMNTHAVIFHAPHHLSYWCSWPKNMSYDNWTVEKWLNLSQPTKLWWLKDDDHFESCRFYNIDYKKYSSHSEEKLKKISSNLTVSRCKSFNYSESYGDTIIQQWTLVCEDKTYIGISELLFHIGLMLGNLIFGVLSDRFGRKKVLFTGIFLQPMFGIITATSSTMPFYMTTRFLFGVSLGGSGNIGFIIVTEIVGNRMRTVVCGVFFIQYALALVYLPMIAYLFQHWRKLQLAISIPNALLLVFIGFVPESPQWLLYMQHQEHAENILRFAANFNDRNIPASFCLRRVQLPGEGAGEVIPQRNTIFAILKDCYLLKITLILMVLWTGLIFCYSVIILYLVYLNHNVYCTLMMTGGLQLVAFSITVPLMHRFSHSRTVLVSVIFCALSLCPVFFLSNVGPYSLGHPVVIVLLFSMFPCAMTMAALWNYSARVYPTGLRCQAFGIMTLFGHLGSLFTPVYLTKIVKVPVTSVIILMGVYVALGVFALGLTDCRNRELPDTIMDAEHYKQRVKPMRWTTVCIYSSKSEEKELRVIEFDSETEYT